MGLVRNALGLSGTPMRVPLFPSAQVGWNSEAQFRVGLDVLDEASATVRGRQSFQEAAKEGCRAEQGSVYSDLPAKPRSRFQKDEMGITFEMTSRVGIACSCSPKEKQGKSRRVFKKTVSYSTSLHTCIHVTVIRARPTVFSDAAAPRHSWRADQRDAAVLFPACASRRISSRVAATQPQPIRGSWYGVHTHHRRGCVLFFLAEGIKVKSRSRRRCEPDVFYLPRGRAELHPQTLPAVEVPPPLQDALRMRQVTGL
jgi:hypothetical protein